MSLSLLLSPRAVGSSGRACGDVWTSAGGGGLGGGAVFRRPDVAAEGGVDLGGAAEVPPSADGVGLGGAVAYPDPGEGGVALGGAAELLAAEGGLGLGGAAPDMIAAQGGLGLGGAAPDMIAAQGVALGGAAAELLAAEGGLGLGGLADDLLSAQGGVGLGGAADYPQPGEPCDPEPVFLLGVISVTLGPCGGGSPPFLTLTSAGAHEWAGAGMWNGKTVIMGFRMGFVSYEFRLTYDGVVGPWQEEATGQCSPFGWATTLYPVPVLHDGDTCLVGLTVAGF